MYIDKLLSRLQEVETAHRLEQKTTDALRQQLNAYREDFEGERLDRHRAQERLVNVERQMNELRPQVHIHTHTVNVNLIIYYLYKISSVNTV